MLKQKQAIINMKKNKASKFDRSETNDFNYIKYPNKGNNEFSDYNYINSYNQRKGANNNPNRVSGMRANANALRGSTTKGGLNGTSMVIEQDPVNCQCGEGLKCSIF